MRAVESNLEKVWIARLPLECNTREILFRQFGAVAEWLQREITKLWPSYVEGAKVFYSWRIWTFSLTEL